MLCVVPRPERGTTPSGFRDRLLARLRNTSRQEGVSAQRLQQRVAFDRLLARLSHEHWLLKGGFALELRYSWTQRPTKTSISERPCLWGKPLLPSAWRSPARRWTTRSHSSSAPPSTRCKEHLAAPLASPSQRASPGSRLLNFTSTSPAATPLWAHQS